MSLQNSLFAAVAALGLLAGSASAGDTDASRRPLHAVSNGHVAARGHRAPVQTGHRAPVQTAHRAPVHSPHGRPVAQTLHRPAYRPAVRVRYGHEHQPRAHRHSAHCHHYAGHYETQLRDVVRPGHYVEREIPARFEVRWDRHHGGFISVLVQPREVIREWVPRRIVQRRVQVWVDSHWSCGF